MHASCNHGLISFNTYRIPVLSSQKCKKSFSGNRKPYIDQHGNEHAADRQVAEQPFLTGDRYNTRKLNNLAFHRVMSGDLPKTKKECLCNFQFLIHRLKGTSVR